MNKLFAVLAASAAMLVSAYAAEIEGTVKSVDAANATIVLEDGTSLKVAADVKLDGVEAGKKVKVTTNDANAVPAVEVVQ